MAAFGERCSVILLALSIAVVCSVSEAANRSFTIDYDGNTFLKDGKPFRYISGSIHYSRVPRIYWRDRLLKMYAAGLNAIEFYVPWNYHEADRGVYNFTGQTDVVEFIKTAQDVGLLVILRSGPYICGEWEFGGFPVYILEENPNTVFRTMDPTYINAVDKWYNVLLPKLKPLLYANGGPIIMVQVENEYGSYFACDYDYIRYLREILIKLLGDDVVLFSTDGDGAGFLKCGTLEGIYSTIDFGITYNPKAAFKAQRAWEPKGPLVNSEFYSGWLDHWGQKHSIVDTDAFARSLDMLLAYGANINMYMFHGGTNYGYMNGANYPKYQPVPTSYDYDAPISEAGDITDKYYAIRQIISKYKELPEMPIPPDTKKYAYYRAEMHYLSSLTKSLALFSHNGDMMSKYPLTMEEIGQNYGFILYHTMLTKTYNWPAVLMAKGIRDRGYVMVENDLHGILIRGSVTSVNVTGQIGQFLYILVENQGRINFGSGINNNTKGLIMNVTLNNETMTNWTMTSVTLDEEQIQFFMKQTEWIQPKTLHDTFVPSIYTGQFQMLQGFDPVDTYLDLRTWTKGQVLINGFNLGRYWPKAGPQVTLFLPKSLLMPYPAYNLVFILELEGAPCQNSTTCLAKFTDYPCLSGIENCPAQSRDSANSIGLHHDWHEY